MEDIQFDDMAKALGTLATREANAMDADHFDGLTRTLAAACSRRRTLAAALGGLVTLGALPVDAKKGKKKKEKKKPKPNQFGCLDIGQSCRGNSSLCCSGICQGTKPKKGKKGKKDRKDKSTCVAHNTGVCIAEADTCTAGVEVPCNPSNPSCFCTLTTGNAGFCAAFSGGPAGHCRVCSKDTDCQAEFGAGAACLVLGGICTPLCLTTGRTACAPPCA
jgi:hypothetical protein